MIPRYQKILFAVLLLASLAMGGVVWRQLDRAHQRMIAGQDSAPTKAPEVAPSEQATLLVASDTDGTLLTQIQSLPLPSDPGARARAIIGRLLDLYAASGATHPVPGGASSVAQVFLMPVPHADTAVIEPPASASPSAAVDQPPSGNAGPLLAIVNLTAGFASTHPSGLETETLTILSICGTLHANLPRITEVRFLIDGRQRPTLAGHADLTRTYLATEATPSAGATPQ